MLNTLIFVRRIDLIVPLTIAQCQERLQAFKPTVTAPYHVTVHADNFQIQFGGREQIRIIVNGTLSTDEIGQAQVQAEVGIERTISNLQLVGGLFALVHLMTLAEALDNSLVGDNILGAVALFVGLFWLLLVSGMAYSQHRLRRDVIQLFTTSDS